MYVYYQICWWIGMNTEVSFIWLWERFIQDKSSEKHKFSLFCQYLNFFLHIHSYFSRNFSTVFADFSASFQYFLKRASVLKFPLTATEYYLCKSVPCWKYKANLGQHLLLNYLRAGGLNEIMMYIDWNRIKGKAQ